MRRREILKNTPKTHQYREIIPQETAQKSLDRIVLRGL